MFTFTRGEENRAALPAERLCQIMNVSPRGYRAYRSRPISQRQREDMVILAHIREQHRLSLNSYGRPRMTEELKGIGLEVGHRWVGRLMRQNGISVVRTHKHKVTTDSNHKFNIAPNLLNRDFFAEKPNQKWPLGDCMQSPAGNSRRHQLYLDPRRLALSGHGSGPAFSACHRLGCQRPDEARPRDSGTEHGHSSAQATQRVHPPF